MGNSGNVVVVFEVYKLRVNQGVSYACVPQDLHSVKDIFCTSQRRYSVTWDYHLDLGRAQALRT